MMFQKLLLIIVLPLIAGLATRRFLIGKIGVKRFREITPVFPAISCLGMYTIVFIATALESKIILANPSYILMIALGYAVTAKNHSITIALAIITFGGLSILPPAFAPII